MATVHRPSPAAPSTARGTAPERPVLLATFDVPFAAEASSFAIDVAVESGHPLVVVNAVPSALLPCSLTMRYGYLERPELTAALRAPAELAVSLGVAVERLRLCSPRPVQALLELVAERRPALLVVGPERAKMRRRQYRKAVRRIEASAPCLLWVAPES